MRHGASLASGPISQPAKVARKYGVAPDVTTSTSRPHTKSQCASGLSYCDAAFLSNRFHSMGHAPQFT